MPRLCSTKVGNVVALGFLTVNLILPTDWFLPSANAAPLPVGAVACTALTFVDQSQEEAETYAFHETVHESLFGPVSEGNAHLLYFPTEEIFACGSYPGISHHIPEGTTVSDWTEPEVQVPTRFVVHEIHEALQVSQVGEDPKVYADSHIALITMHNEDTGAYVNCISEINNFYRSSDPGQIDSVGSLTHEETIISTLDLFETVMRGYEFSMGAWVLTPDRPSDWSDFSDPAFQAFLRIYIHSALAESDGCGNLRRGELNFDPEEAMASAVEATGGRIVGPGDDLYMPLFQSALTGRPIELLDGTTVTAIDDDSRASISEQGLGFFVSSSPPKGVDGASSYRATSSPDVLADCLRAALGAYLRCLGKCLRNLAVCYGACTAAILACHVAARIICTYGCAGFWWAIIACVALCAVAILACRVLQRTCYKGCNKIFKKCIKGCLRKSFLACFLQLISYP